MQKYDYIITGTGASGLMLAYHMILDSFFDDKQILLIDKEIKNQNDRTWCFWEKGKGNWNNIISKKWDQIYFGSKHFSDTMSIDPYQYKLIRSKDFYDFVFSLLNQKPNITRVNENLLGLVDEGSIVEVETNRAKYLGDKVFNSVPLSQEFRIQNKYPLLNQHFIGWFIKTEAPMFDEATATFMDFDLEQKGNTRFMYVLPLSKNEALFEYTLFSKDILKDEEYENAIAEYLTAKGIKAYQITEKERGCIPMTSYEFRKQNSKNILHLGTAGGWTKASTGFTFKNTQKKIVALIEFLKNKDDVSEFGKRTRFWYYDLLFLDVLSEENQNGATLFSLLFKRNKTIKILKFLNEETTFFEELRIMATMPAGKFIKMVWKRAF